MVARPPLKLQIVPMRVDDLPAVHAIERASFDSPWPPDAYRSELETNRLAQYLVVRAGDEIVAYGGMWLMVDEAHIITFAVHPAWRRQHIGERLLLAFLDLAIDARRPRGDARGPPVEPAGPPALREVRLPAGRPPAALLQRQRRGRPDHDHRSAARPADARADRPAARRARCGAGAGRRRPSGRDADAMSGVTGPRHRIVLRRDRDRPHRGRPADPCRTSSPRRSRSTRRPAGSCPRSRPARTCAGSSRSSTRPGPTPGSTGPTSTAIAVTYGPGLAGSLLVGINFAKALAWVHDVPLVGVNHLEGHVYAAWLRDPGEAERDDPGLPARRARRLRRPHLPRRDARPPDLPAARHDRRRRRRRGVRQGRPAARARLPGRAGDRPGGRGRDGRATASSRGPGSATRTTSASPGSRPRPAGSSTRPAPTPGSPADPDAPLPDAARRRARLGLPGRGRRRARDEDDPGRPDDRRALDRARRRAWPRTAPCAPGWPARPRRSASR